MAAMTKTRSRLSALTFAVLAACTGGGMDDPDLVPGADAGQEESWHDLIASAWALPAGAERYLCVRTTLEEDVYIDAFDAISPGGTHHTVLTVGPPSGPDGARPCNSFENHHIMIFGSGVGTEAFSLPPGVAVRVEAGQQLLLNLHLFNASEDELEGVSGIRARIAARADVEHVAESVLMGPLDLDIGPGEQEVVGGCTLDDDATIFAVAPHMHQLGRHMTVHARRASGDALIHDGPYDFDAQEVLPVEPVELAAGDFVEVRCRYDNDTGERVRWGESSLDEMCFAGVYRYPVRDDAGLFVCNE